MARLYSVNFEVINYFGILLFFPFPERFSKDTYQEIAPLRNGQIITCKFDMLSFHPDDPSF